MLLTSLKQRLVRRISGFDERKLGFSGFKKLMLRVAEEGNIKIRSVDLVDWILMADEPDPVQRAADDDDEVQTEQANEVEVVEPVEDQQDQPVSEAEAPDAEYDGDVAEPAPEPERSRVEPARPDPSRFEGLLAEKVADLDLPEPEDAGAQADRIADLIAMGFTLEDRDGSDNVMFNALCNEISDALAAGIEAEDPHITSHWSNDCSKGYIVKLIRGLASNQVFQYRNVSSRDPETNRSRRRRVFGLNHEHPLIGVALAARLGLPYEPQTEDGPVLNDALATPALDEHGSAEAAHAESAVDAEAAVIFGAAD